MTLTVQDPIKRQSWFLRGTFRVAEIVKSHRRKDCGTLLEHPHRSPFHNSSARISRGPDPTNQQDTGNDEAQNTSEVEQIATLTRENATKTSVVG